MFITALKAIIGILAITGGRISVQAAWRRAFPGVVAADDDVLANRIGCLNCPRDSTCSQSECKSEQLTQTEKL